MTINNTILQICFVNCFQTTNFCCSDLAGHFGCVNTVGFSHGQGRYLVTGYVSSIIFCSSTSQRFCRTNSKHFINRSDDTRVLLWEVSNSLIARNISLRINVV